MRINLLLIIIFLSVLVYAGIQFESGVVGLTRLNGAGCECHGIEPNASVQVWIEGPDSVFVRDTVNFKILMTGGSSVNGGYNVANIYGALEAIDSFSQAIVYVDTLPLQLTHTMPRPFGNATVYWDFIYIAPDGIVIDTIYSVANSVNGDGNPQEGDEWNFGANFPVTIVEEIIPVEFISFNAVSDWNTISITWTTATETNNYGFEIQRSNDNLIYSTIGFVKGNGTTTETNDYSFKDKFSKQGVYNYRLKQIDFDGSFLYSVVIEVNINVKTFSLEQNYPNPFNPSTTIKYTIQSSVIASGTKQSQFVTLKVYDILGNEVATLVHEEKPPGIYQVGFDAANLTSGVYFYKLETNDFIDVKKMILLR